MSRASRSDLVDIAALRRARRRDAVDFIAMIARMETQEEFERSHRVVDPGDCAVTLDSLIVRAREIVNECPKTTLGR